MATGKGYSLWLFANKNKPAYTLPARVIGELAKIYNTPIFPPHVTLVNDIDLGEEIMIALTQELITSLPSLPIELKSLASNNHYFQRLFAVVEPTPTLILANARAQTLFGHTKDYRPHHSFAYGDLSPQQVTTLRQRLEKIAALRSLSFTAESIELWSTEGPFEHWYFVRRFPLHH